MYLPSGTTLYFFGFLSLTVLSIANVSVFAVSPSVHPSQGELVFSFASGILCFSFPLEHTRVCECGGEAKADALFKLTFSVFEPCELFHSVEESHWYDLVLP